MKKILFGLIASVLMFTFWVSCSEKQPGLIYGIATDKATGEPVKSAGVELQPVGLRTVTGSDGSFEFPNLEVGEYNLYVTKTGYVDYNSSPIILKSGQQAPSNVQLEKVPHALRVISSDSRDINSLDFGDQEDDVSRAFIIFNDGTETLEWEITITATWLHVSKESGILISGRQQSIIATINRDLLQDGENVTTMHITSNDGAKELVVKATGLSAIITLEVTECTSTTAVLNGRLTRAGDPLYSEVGFVYGTMPTPSITNGTIRKSLSNVQLGNFSEAVSNLEQGSTYYVRAYAKNSRTIDYGATVSFIAEPPQFVVLHSAGIMVQTADLGYTDWNSASSMCNNSTVGGYYDWRLPTINELYVIYNNRELIGNFGGDIYWSSTEVSTNPNLHQCVNFLTGATRSLRNSYDDAYVRAVRTISNQTKEGD